MKLQTETTQKLTAELDPDQVEAALRQAVAQLYEAEVPLDAAVKVYSNNGKSKGAKVSWHVTEAGE